MKNLGAVRISNLQSFIDLFVEVYAEINKELQEIYQEFKDKGFDILDFPCNQFGEQAKGSAKEIHTFCTGRFGITFPQFAKIDVNGEIVARFEPTDMKKRKNYINCFIKF